MKVRKKKVLSLVSRYAKLTEVERKMTMPLLEIVDKGEEW